MAAILQKYGIVKDNGNFFHVLPFKALNFRADGTVRAALLKAVRRREVTHVATSSLTCEEADVLSINLNAGFPHLILESLNKAETIENEQSDDTLVPIQKHASRSKPILSPQSCKEQDFSKLGNSLQPTYNLLLSKTILEPIQVFPKAQPLCNYSVKRKLFPFTEDNSTLENREENCLTTPFKGKETHNIDTLDTDEQQIHTRKAAGSYSKNNNDSKVADYSDSDVSSYVDDSDVDKNYIPSPHADSNDSIDWDDYYHVEQLPVAREKTVENSQSFRSNSQQLLNHNDADNDNCESVVEFKRNNKDNTIVPHPSYPILPQHLKQYEQMLPAYGRPKYEEPAEQVAASSAGGKKSLRYFCPFCKQDVAQLPRHLEAMHSNETIVGRALLLPKKHTERKDIFTAIRLWGTCMFNDNRLYNKGTLRVRRRPSREQDASRFVYCSSCGNMINRRRFAKHYRFCTGKQLQESHQHLAECDALRFDVHLNANEILSSRIFPSFQNDNVVKAIRYDSAVISYGNILCLKYSSSIHHDKMIRSNLRILGRILLCARKICSTVTDWPSLLVPAHIDTICEAIHALSGFQLNDGIYAHPATATHAVNVIKVTAKVWRVECIKRENKVCEEKVMSFLKLFKVHIMPIVNKTVTENRTAIQRQKQVVLPSTHDINLLILYTTNGYKDAISALKSSSNFNYSLWYKLGSHLLIYITVFNKRRPGEVQRMYLENFINKAQLTQNDHCYERLTEEQRLLAKRYKLFVIRGKLNRSVNVLMSHEVTAALEMFISLRGNAGVLNKNPYVFGLPGGEHRNIFKYIDACKILRDYSVKCGAKDPITLRCTIMRKSLATVAASLNLSENQIKDVADHLGHDSAIHKNIYRQATYERSVLAVASTLEAAIGSNTDSNAAASPNNGDGIVAHKSVDCRPRRTRMTTTSTPQKEKIQDSPCKAILHSTLSCEEELALHKFYCNKQRELNRQPTIHDMKEALDLSEFYKVSLPKLKIFLDNLQRKPNTPVKCRYYNSSYKSPRNLNRSFQYREVLERRRWSLTEKKLLRQLFHQYIDSDKPNLPSKMEIEEAINTYPLLRGRSCQVIKAAVHNMRKRRTANVNY